MNIIDLTHEPIDLLHVLERAKSGPLRLIGPDGQEYLLAETDDFEKEVDQIRTSSTFQQFLDNRLATRHRRRLVTDVLHEVEEELAHNQSDEAPGTDT